MAFALRLWSRSLKRRPVVTNVAAYAAFYSAAEISQQTFNKFNAPGKPDINWPGAAKIIFVGTTIYPTTLYFWFKFLDRKFVGTGLKVAISKMLTDQLTMTPFLLALFFTFTSILEGRSPTEELKNKYLTAFIANQCVWMPMQTVNFFFMPSHLRVVFVAAVSFFWINVLCFIKRQENTNV